MPTITMQFIDVTFEVMDGPPTRRRILKVLGAGTSSFFTPSLVGTVTGTRTQKRAVRASSPPRNGLGDPREFEAWLDTIMTMQLSAYHVPGATVAIVKDGEMFLAKGYGYADLESRTPVVADETIFRIESVSKLFTWTAVMQGVEDGRLNLRTDVNRYLEGSRVHVPETYPDPVTLETLGTHTAGFDQIFEGGDYNTAAEFRANPLEKTLVQYQPARVRPPNELTAYSNYGASLAGFVVQHRAGLSFDEYLERHIFEPLGMRHSTVRQPLPPRLAPDLATAYQYIDGDYEPTKFGYVRSPEGGMSSTATDIAKFMIAHLQNGRYDGRRILAPATARNMHRQHFTNDPRVNGWTYGFLELSQNGQRIIGHYGDDHFHSMLALLPEQNVGLFVSYTADGGVEARKELLDAFMDRYYPAPEAPLRPPPAGAAKRAAQVAGEYRSTLIPCRDYSRDVSLREVRSATLAETPDLVVRAGSSGDITIGPSVPGAPAMSLVEAHPFVYRAVEVDDKVVFDRNARGEVTTLLDNADPTQAYLQIGQEGGQNPQCTK